MFEYVKETKWNGKCQVKQLHHVRQSHDCTAIIQQDLPIFTFQNQSKHQIELSIHNFNLLSSKPNLYFMTVSENCLKETMPITLILCPLEGTFDNNWWPLQIVWIQMSPHKTEGVFLVLNCFTLRLYNYKQTFGWKHWIFANFQLQNISYVLNYIICMGSPVV